MGQPASAAPRSTGAERRAEILVCEDEHLVAFDIKTRLERMGHVPVLVYSGEAAIERTRQRRFDLLLMDIRLKGDIDGIEAARRIHEVSDVPVIYLTAYSDRATLDRALATEPYGYVLKPFQEQELKAAIEMALYRHEGDKQRLEQQQVHRFLADASACMAATLDYRAVARGAAELIVPRYADWCMVRLDEMNDAVPALRYTYPESDEPQGEVVTIPLLARGQPIGALVLVPKRHGPRYSTADLVFLEDFGNRLGMALDNALLYRAAARAIRMRDDVLAIVSHDLRTPLATILLRGETVAAHPELAKHGAGIVRAAQRMKRLIDDLLDASAINAGQLALERGRHLVGDIAREALEASRAPAEEKGVALRGEIPGEDIAIDADRDRIVQVLSNLLGNAIKFTPIGGRAVLRVAHERPFIRFEVEDTGPGIPDEERSHLFERFWRGEARTEGAGLGLFISRGIVAAHGGTLDVDTELGAGSRFFFKLPELPS